MSAILLVTDAPPRVVASRSGKQSVTRFHTALGTSSDGVLWLSVEVWF